MAPGVLTVPTGSPPRAWGAYVHAPIPDRDWRFTPTCVGSIPIRPRQPLDFSVHPHVRGEHAVSAQPTTDLPGSPPRAWGAYWTQRLFCAEIGVLGRRSPSKSSMVLLVRPAVRIEKPCSVAS